MLHTLVYIAGPYRAKGFMNKPILRWFAIAWNIYKARRYAKEIWKAGFIAICPHLNTCFFDGIVPDAQFLIGDLYIIDQCEIVFMLPDYLESEGACNERAYAIIHDKKICYSLESLRALEKTIWAL